MCLFIIASKCVKNNNKIKCTISKKSHLKDTDWFVKASSNIHGLPVHQVLNKRFGTNHTIFDYLRRRRVVNQLHSD